METGLPDGLLLSWYGDDFTGSAAVMEALTFSGVPAVLFLAPPTPAQLSRFSGLRAVGVASTARTHGPDWMDAELPGAFAALAGLGAPLLHYKACSTLDSAPHVGSIGRAIDIGARVIGGAYCPVLIAAPEMGRYQAFGTLFAAAFGAIHRLDRHPVMARHPVTPMGEADVARHLSAQTERPTGCLTLVDLASEAATEVGLDRLRREGVEIVTLDAVDAASTRACGRLLWQGRDEAPFVAGSQGIEYALIEYWRATGLIGEAPAATGIGAAKGMVIVSGSVSPVTAAQIDWSLDNGFAGIALDAARVLDEGSAAGALAEAEAAALAALSEGRDPLIFTARGPEDPAVAAFPAAVARSGLSPEDANRRIGEALGQLLDRIIRHAGLRRAVISGGDTSGHATRELGVFALSALAPTIPGAAIFGVQADGPHDGLELALKGGQMGSPDYFGWVRDGGGPR